MIPKQATDWAKAWREGRIGFHRSSPNPNLERYAHVLQNCQNILFPLCGKTLDMHYLHQKGHHCFGVERVEKAIHHFFLEWNGIPKRVNTRYQHQNISIFHQNIFSIGPKELPVIHGIFDRAALVALPVEIRPQYAQHMLSLLAKGGKILLITINMPRPQDQGPPFLVRKESIPDLFSDASTVECLETQRKTPQQEPFLIRSGMPWLEQHIWSITK